LALAELVLLAVLVTTEAMVDHHQLDRWLLLLAVAVAVATTPKLAIMVVLAVVLAVIMASAAKPAQMV
jgi:hypothetical protein